MIDPTENEKERIPKVRLSVKEDDLIERQYDLESFWKFVNSNKIKLSTVVTVISLKALERRRNKDQIDTQTTIYVALTMKND